MSLKRCFWRHAFVLQVSVRKFLLVINGNMVTSSRSKWPFVLIRTILFSLLGIHDAMKKYMRGFTLIELMLVLAISAILVALAAPSFNDTIEKSRVEAVQNDLMRDIAFARQQALSRNSLVSICRSADGASCAGAGDWNQGWIVVVESVDGTAGTVEAGEEILRVHDAINTQDDFEGTSSFVQFGPSGALQLPAAGSPTFTVCSPNNSRVKGLLLLRSGRSIASRQSTGGDEYVQLSGGTPVALGCS